MSHKINKILLAYSGGLDTSIALHWLQNNYNCEVVTFTADIGQGEEVELVHRKAEMLGVKDIYIEDLREEFARNYIFPMFRANAVYEGSYLLGSAIARPLIAKRQIEIAQEIGADAVAHGATSKGNDQVRFELTYYALNPNIKVIAPWREWHFSSRTQLFEYAEQHQIPTLSNEYGQAPYSIDSNLLHTSYEGKALEDPWLEPNKQMFLKTRDPEDAPDSPIYINITFEKGDPIAIDETPLSPVEIFLHLNEIGSLNGVGRIDNVENRITGLKTRNIYETPGGTILFHAHRAMESLTLDRDSTHFKDQLIPRYAELIYNGFWFTPEREMIQAAINHSQQYVNGTVRLKIYKGSVQIVGRKSSYSLYNQNYVSFETNKIYDPLDAAGFIKLTTLHLQLLKKVRNF